MSTKSNRDVTIQQLGLGCAIGSAYAEDGSAWEEGLDYGAVVLGGAFIGMASFGAQATVASAGAATLNPVGLSYWVATGVVGL